MDARDICAIGDVLAEGFDETAARVEEVHRAVVMRSFAAAGPVRGLPQRLHDRVAARVYGTVRSVGPALIRSGAIGLGAAVDPDAARVEGTPRGKAFVSAFNGVFGDALARRRNGLALDMTLRADGRDVVPLAPALEAAYPAAGGRLVVFVHGFGETDDSWRWFSLAHWGEPGISYGELLKRELGYTPLYVHYNSGREVADNGAELSRLLEDVVAGWPVPVETVVLVGHSAGGVVAREAVRQAASSRAPWIGLVSHVVSIGVPYHAITAERALLIARRVLGRLPETRPLARLLDARSAGLKDLRGRSGSGDPLPGGVRDLRLPRERTGVGHFKLLNHPAVYKQLKAGLSVRTARAPARAARGARYGLAARGLRARTRSRQH
jgi:pimeloyl-ACP methyl ester carboxylesterase